ncbi:MAG TPA: DUF2892 domain-containing protein [Nitrospirota bacterium]
MSERTYRILLGITLILIQLVGSSALLYGYIGLLIFEGVTNWRIPLLVSRLRKGRELLAQEQLVWKASRISFDVERALRLVIAALLVLSLIVFPDALWFIPWFLGFALTMAGITGVCPMAMALRKAGFRS